MTVQFTAMVIGLNGVSAQQSATVVRRRGFGEQEQHLPMAARHVQRRLTRASAISNLAHRIAFTAGVDGVDVTKPVVVALSKGKLSLTPQMLMEEKLAQLLRLIRLATLMFAPGTAKASMEAGAAVPKGVQEANGKENGTRLSNQLEEAKLARLT